MARKPEKLQENQKMFFIKYHEQYHCRNEYGYLLTLLLGYMYLYSEEAYKLKNLYFVTVLWL